MKVPGAILLLIRARRHEGADPFAAIAQMRMPPEAAYRFVRFRRAVRDVEDDVGQIYAECIKRHLKAGADRIPRPGEDGFDAAQWAAFEEDRAKILAEKYEVPVPAFRLDPGCRPEGISPEALELIAGLAGGDPLVVFEGMAETANSA